MSEQAAHGLPDHRRVRVALVFGGTSSEHGVSCLTAAGVFSALDRCRYEVVGIDNGPGAQPLESADLPERCLMVFGSEGEGISAELSAGCSRLLRIGQYGSTRSINVAAAAAVAMHAWILQHAGPAPD